VLVPLSSPNSFLNAWNSWKVSKPVPKSSKPMNPKVSQSSHPKSSQRESSQRKQNAKAWLAGAVLALAGALVSLPSAVWAVPVDVYFNGPRPASNPGTAYGISQASALASGVPILEPVGTLQSATGRLGVTLPPNSELDITPNPPTSTQNTIISNWSIQNTTGSVIEGAAYLLFTHTTPYDVGSRSVEYVDENVGLRIDAEQGWVLIHARSGDVDYYYPALLLDRSVSDPNAGNLSAGERVSAAVHYLVAESLVGIRNNGRTNYYLPQLQLGFAYAVIPEPGTALLMGVGIALLAVRPGRARG